MSLTKCLDANLECTECGRDYSGHSNDPDIFIGAPCSSDDCPSNDDDCETKTEQ